MQKSGAHRPVENQAERALFVAAVLFALILVSAALRYSPPAPKPADAAASDFSAVRAHAVLEHLLGDEAPHPVGSPANERVRGRIEDELRRLGLEAEVQRAFNCNRGGSCAEVQNVLARLPGTEDGDSAVLLSAHYDSVGCGVGASDNGSGVAAVLEIARALRAGPRPRSSLIFLFVDGEEAGLLGAEAFAEEHPWSSQVRIAVNLDSRGSSGPSLMFETGGDDADLIDLFASSVERPVANSVMSTIYRVMPNDTDFSVFRREGIEGFNFAFLGGVGTYHRPADTLERASLATLQHQGGNALAVVRALAAADLGAAAGRRAMFFDLFAWKVVRWRQALAAPLAILAAVLMVATLLVLARRGRLSWRQLAWGAFGWWATVLASLITAIALSLVLWLTGAFPSIQLSLWLPQPWPAEAAFWLLGLAVASWIPARLGHRTSFWSVWCGTWIWWSLLGLVLALTAPAASYPFVLPALSAGLFGLPLVLSRRAADRQPVAVVVPAVVVAVLWFSTLRFLFQGLGTLGLFLIATLVATVATTLAPLFVALAPRRQRLLPRVAGAAALVFAVVVFILPQYSQDMTKPLNILFFEDHDEGMARWILMTSGSVPEPLLQSADFGEEPALAFPWSSGRSKFFTAPAATLDVPPPKVEILESSTVGPNRRLRLRLTSPRGARDVRLLIPKSAKVDSVSIEGEALPEPLAGPANRRRSWRHYTCLGVPVAGCEIELVLATQEEVRVIVRDESSGLPAGGKALLQARPALYGPIEDGDVTVVSQSVSL